MPSLVFNAENHLYLLDGKPLPSITQIIKPLVDYGMVPPAVLENAANFGKAVHKLVELEEEGTLDADALDDKLVPVINAYREWRATNGVLPYESAPACEIPMAHVKLGYAGTPDLIFDGLAVVEIKTRKTNKLTDPIQTAAQELLWRANGGAKGDYSHHVLELYADGRHKFETFTKAEKKLGLARFRYMLDALKMNQTIQSWKGQKS